MEENMTYFTEPNSDRRYYNAMFSQPVTPEPSSDTPTFSQPQPKADDIKKQLEFLHHVTINGNSRLEMLIGSLQKELALKHASEEEPNSRKLSASDMTIDSGYTSEEGVSPAVNPDIFADESTKQPKEKVSFTLHINITLNSQTLHHSSHYSLDATKYITIQDMLALIEPLYLAHIPETRYQAYNLSLSPGTTYTSDKKTTPPCTGVLYLSETYSRGSENYARTRLLLNESAVFNCDKYTKWYWRNVVNGLAPKREGWTSNYTWEGDELEVSFSMHLKQELLRR